MKKALLAAAVILALALSAAAEAPGAEDFYYSITSSAEYTQRPYYQPFEKEEHDLLQDIKVSLAEAVPFAFLYTFLSIYGWEASNQGTIKPVMKTMQDYAVIYEVSIASFAVFNTVVNVLGFYDYNYRKKEKKDGGENEKE